MKWAGLTRTKFATLAADSFRIIHWLPLTVILAFYGSQRSGVLSSQSQAGPPKNYHEIGSIPFEEMNGNDVFNASGVVPLGDSRFLFCDNNSNDALFELDLTPGGQKKGKLIRRPLAGLAAEAVDDLEGMAFVKNKGRRFVFITSSLYVKKSKNDSVSKVQPSGLLRVRLKSHDQLLTENLPGFRDWFVRQAPDLAASAAVTPDEGGLNIEGLAWDAARQALLFGVRTPVSGGKPVIIPVKIKKLNGAWTTENLKMLPPIRLSLDAAEGEQGIRDLQYIPARKSFLVIVGKTISESKAPFALYEWNGNQEGKVRRLNVSFAKKMKPEGVTGGTIGGKPVLLFVDDAGGFQVVWLNQKLF